jgi:hypothetical protein
LGCNDSDDEEDAGWEFIGVCDEWESDVTWEEDGDDSDVNEEEEVAQAGWETACNDVSED